MLVTSMMFSVGCLFYRIKPCKLGGAIIGASLRLWSDVVRISIASNTLGVHSAHSTGTFACVFGAPINAALLGH